MTERVNTGGLVSFVYQGKQNSSLTQDEKSEINKGYEEARKNRLKRNIIKAIAASILIIAAIILFF